MYKSVLNIDIRMMIPEFLMECSIHLKYDTSRVKVLNHFWLKSFLNTCCQSFELQTSLRGWMIWWGTFLLAFFSLAKLQLQGPEEVVVQDLVNASLVTQTSLCCSLKLWHQVTSEHWTDNVRSARNWWLPLNDCWRKLMWMGHTNFQSTLKLCFVYIIFLNNMDV